MKGIEDSRSLYWNYILFCFLYSCSHGAVDSVLAYSTAELGDIVGSNGSFSLYICYTFSALLLAKPLLRVLSPKNSVFCGLCGMLCYVALFFLAIRNLYYAPYIFILGGCLGGIGAGIIWPSQAVYFSVSAINYAESAKLENSFALGRFAAIFTMFYLGLETTFKAVATVIYISSGESTSWHNIVFGVYTILAYIAVTSFGLLVRQPAGRVMSVDKDNSNILKADINNNNYNSTKNDIIDNSCYSFNKNDMNSYPFSILSDERDEAPSESPLGITELEQKFPIPGEVTQSKLKIRFLESMLYDVLSVMKAIQRERLLQLMIPYQICQGITAVLFDYYVNKHIVATSLGSGYIGIYSALGTLAAVLLAYPFAIVSQYSLGRGKWYVMIFGTLCWLFSGLGIVLFDNTFLGRWYILLFYYIIHGAGRCCYENTNKAVIAEYFEGEKRETAFAGTNLYVMMMMFT